MTMLRAKMRAVEDSDRQFPVGGHSDEREMYLDWLRFLRGAVLDKATGISDEQARWTPDAGALLPLVGVVNHLTRVEWRWIYGGIRGEETERTEEEFRPGPEVTIDDAVAAYRVRAAMTDAVVRSLPLDAPCQWGEGTNLRWVLVHLINETARHAGHADATRELLDGTTGE
jgi:hypothetical protein